MSDVQDTPKPWSACSPGELLDMAQAELRHAQGQHAAVLVAAAQVQSQEQARQSLSQTFASLNRTFASKRFA